MTHELNANDGQCPICAGTTLLKGEAFAFDTPDKQRFSYIHCQSCHFAWQYPFQRTIAQSQAEYEDAYADQGEKHSAYFNLDNKKKITQCEFEFVKELPVGEKTLLDIGAGAGVFAYQAACDGWQVSAVDPALSIGAECQHPNLSCYKGMLDALPQGEKYNVVTLWDVIEHATEPVALINSAKQLLSPDGWLVLATGNFACADRIIGGQNYWIYQLDHRWYFTPHGVAALLSKLGFEDIVYCERVLRPNWKGKRDALAPTTLELMKAFIKKPWAALSTWQRHQNLTEIATVPRSGLSIFTIAARLKPEA